MGLLQELKIIEPAGIGPCPGRAMLLAEPGVDVVRVDRLAHSGPGAALAAPIASATDRERRDSIDRGGC